MGFLSEQWRHIRGNVKWDAIKYSGALVITATGYLLHKVAHLPDWTVATGIFIAAVVVFAIAIGNKRPAATQQPSQSISTSTPQVIVQAVGLEQNIEQFEEVYRKNAGAFLREAETLFKRLAAHFTNPVERESFLMRMFAGSAVVVLHNEVWWLIWRSQIELLQELNTRAMSLEEVRGRYDAAASAQPVVYKNYPFEQWLAYLRSHNLIVQAGDVQLTVRGGDFLRFMLQERWSIKSRFNA